MKSGTVDYRRADALHPGDRILVGYEFVEVHDVFRDGWHVVVTWRDQRGTVRSVTAYPTDQFEVGR